MGLFDKMFGSGASAAQGEPNAQQRFNELKLKYQSVLNAIDQQQVELQNLHVQDNKLFIKGTAPSLQARDRVLEQIKLDFGNDKDLNCDIGFDESRTAVSAGGQTRDQGW